MANEMGSEFKASNGWLWAWRKKYNVKFYKVCGESNDVDLEEVEKFKNRLPEIIDNVSPENAFNSDETGLFFRALPDKTLSVKADACKGGKMAKERLTVMLTCSATGEKLKPLVIGKANRARCFKNIKTENLPCTWRSNKKAWMTGETFQNWVFELNSEMKRQKRNILLFLDNATSHTDVTLSNVTIKFLPPNATSKLQPLDLGIIRAFKARYRKHLMRRLLSKMDSCETVSDLVKSLTVLDAIHWIKQAWNETSSSTIVKCFRDAGFVFDSEVHDNNMDSSDDEYEDDDLPIAELVRRSQFAQQIDVEGVDDMHDAECVLPTEETYEGDWEKTILSDLVGKKCEDSDNDDDDSVHSVCDDVILQTSSFTDYKSVETCLEDLKLFALEKR